MTTTDTHIGPPPELRYKRRLRPGTELGLLWRARGLVRSLAERELRARYKQAILGFAWALVTPLALMAVFTLFFQRVANVHTGGAPYALFAYLGILPWTFFSSSVSMGGQSLLQNIPLLNKVHCPREVFPLASVAVSSLDSVVQVGALGALFAITGFAPKAAAALWIPVLLAIQVAFTVGIVFMVSSLVVYLRDLRHAIPIILQLGLFATPVAYPMSVIPEGLQVPYSFINPLGAVIDGYRRTILYDLRPQLELLVPAAITAVLVLVGGYWMFKRLEKGFADVA